MKTAKEFITTNFPQLTTKLEEELLRGQVVNAMEEYAEEVLKEAADLCAYTEDKIGDHEKTILNLINELNKK